MHPISIDNFDCGQRLSKNGIDFHFFSFNDIETIVLYYRHYLLQHQFEGVVSLARGGNYAATMISQFCGIPLHYAFFDRPTKTVTHTPNIPTKILLVDDVAGYGITLSSVKEYLESNGHEVFVFCIAKDQKSRVQPHFCFDTKHLKPIFPWERTLGFCDTQVDPHRPKTPEEHEQWTLAFDLDGIFLPDIPHELYLQNLSEALRQRQYLQPYPKRPFNWNENIVITARLEEDRNPTEQWLHQYEIRPKVLKMRPHLDIDPALFKSKTCIELNITEYVESEKPIAQKIANILPDLVVWHYEPHTQKLTRVFSNFSH